MTTRTENKARTRALVLSAARELFERDGYEATTLRRIAKHMSRSTGSVFLCFRGKAELFAAVYGVPPLDPVEAVRRGYVAPELAEAA